EGVGAGRLARPGDKRQSRHQTDADEAAHGKVSCAPGTAGPDRPRGPGVPFVSQPPRKITGVVGFRRGGHQAGPRVPPHPATPPSTAAAAVLRAANLSDAADTTGAVCSQLAGACWGKRASPRNGAGLAGREWIERALQGLLG